MTGKRFKLERSTLALDVLDGKRTAVTLPAGAIIEVVKGSTNEDGLIDVLWDSRKVMMFAVDVDVRGSSITDHGAGA